MKKISIIGVALAIIGLLAGVYCQLVIVPAYNALDTGTLSDAQIPQWRNLGDQKFLMGSIALFSGILATIIGLFTGIKKQKMGWIALALGLVSFLLGAMQSTHMFD